MVNESFFRYYNENYNDAMLDEPRTYLDAKVAWNVGTAIVCVEFFLALIFNAIVIILIFRRGSWNKMSFFVMHLAVSDFMMGIFFIFPVVIDRLLDIWLGGYALCKILKYLSQTVCFASTYMLVVLSADRLFAIVRPLSSTRTGVWYRRLLVLSAWSLAALLAIPDGFYAEVVVINGKPFCEHMYPPEALAFIFTMYGSINVFVPAVLLFVCYTWIVIVIMKRGKKGFNVRMKSDNLGCEFQIRKTKPKPESNIITRAKIRSIKITFVVVSVFLLCWSPVTFNMILTVYNVIPTGPHVFIFNALAPLNSVANPIVFLIFNHKMLCKRPNRRLTTEQTTKTRGLIRESELISSYRRSMSTNLR